MRSQEEIGSGQHTSTRTALKNVPARIEHSDVVAVGGDVGVSAAQSIVEPAVLAYVGCALVVWVGWVVVFEVPAHIGLVSKAGQMVSWTGATDSATAAA